ncbi:DUF4905 domain-containing protein [Parapedobacter sp. DT-150]|uniref:DUF4905 domain-containing protein n=1 Tax=Parapedobacter sp. DT-150 TaxID=3396162 RepID=UPI003F1BBE69
MDKYTLKTVFQKRFLGLVWRMEVDTAGQVLAVETRDKDGIPSFSAFAYTSGASLIHELPYGDRNWTLAGIADHKLILRAFGDDSPNSAGIACIDATTGEVLWEQFQYTLLAVGERQLRVRHRSVAGGYEQYVDLATGNLTQFNNWGDKPMPPDMVLPQRYVGDIPAVLAGYPVHGDLFYCQIGPKGIWAFHEIDEDRYRVRLVISTGLTVLADEIVLSGLAKMAPELFFMIGQQLFLIGDNKREIVSYLV